MRLLEHPLFETFIQLKWLKLWKYYTATFCFLLLHLIVLTLFTLFHYSHVSGSVPVFLQTVSWHFLLTTNVLLLLLQVFRVYCSLQSPRSKLASSPMSGSVGRREHLYPLVDLLTPTLGFLVLLLASREVTGLTLLYCSWQFMRGLTVFPRVGKNMYIASEVTRTILDFFLSYLVVLLAFTLTFHILLLDTEIFSNIGDSFIKVITMLLGEFEFEDLIQSGQVSWLTKLVFLLFVLLMSIVLINLVIGLAISDVASLR